MVNDNDNFYFMPQCNFFCIYKQLDEMAPGLFAPKPVPPGTIPPGQFAQNFERDCSLINSGMVRSKSFLRVDSPILNMYFKNQQWFFFA